MKVSAIVQDILKQAAVTLIERFKTLQGIEVKVFDVAFQEYQIWIVKDSSQLLVKTFPAGKTVPDLKAEKRATNFAKKLAQVLSSDPT